MKKEQLIQKLQELPDGIEVCVYDFKLNIQEASGDGSGAGIYPNFDIELFTKEDVAEDSEPFAALVIDNFYMDEL